MTIKHHFVSRWNEGWLIEADLSQIEVVIAASLSGDDLLIADLQSRVDLHLMSLALWKYGGDYEEVTRLYSRNPDKIKAERKLAKMLTFQLQYGAGAKSMADKLNVSVADCNAFINGYYARYKVLNEWNQQNIEDVARSMDFRGVKVDGIPVQTGFLKTVSGRILQFDQTVYTEGRYHKVATPVTKIKNYPIQSFATGDLFLLLLGRLYRWIHQKYPEGGCLLTNTVHDSVIFDVNPSICKESLGEICGAIKTRMEGIANDVMQIYNFEIPVSISVDVEVGENWAELEPYLVDK